MKEVLGTITIVLAIIGHAPYIKDTFKGKTQPHLFTWVIWSLVVSIAFLVQWTNEGGAGSWGTGVTALLVIIIAVLSIRKGTGDITKLDKVLFVSALIAIIPWYITKNPTVSIILISIIDACAFLPTIRKTMNDPSSETLITYVLNVARHGLSIIALSKLSFVTVLYPVYLLIMNIVMSTIILRNKLTKEKVDNIKLG